MITVHHLNNSRSQRVLWLLEELGLPYEIQKYQRDPKTMLAPPSLMKVHPLGKSPVITDDGTTVAESGAIIEYLIERYGNGRLAPAIGTPERLRWRYWLHFAEGSAMPPLLLKLIFGTLIPNAPMPFFAKPIARGIAEPSAKCSQYFARQYSGVPLAGIRRPTSCFSIRYSRIAPDSATVTPSSVITGDLPSGCTFCSSGGASIVFGSRWYFTISYGRPSSSSSHSTRCERELLR